MLSANKISYPYIDFPVSIVSFDGFVPINNPNFTKISSKTLKCDFQNGITIKVRSAVGAAGYAKWFEIYNIIRTEHPNNYGKTWISRKMIMRIYSGKTVWDNPGSEEWQIDFNGGMTHENLDKMLKVKDFILEYAENFKTP